MVGGSDSAERPVEAPGVVETIPGEEPILNERESGTGASHGDEATLPGKAATSQGPASAASDVLPDSALPAQGLRQGDSVGRYVVLSRVGAGAMGVVYAAYDPKLDRKVALKLLRDPGGGARSERARQRMLREAQAMARLNHPNVITVHDTGERDGQIFLAMEFVEGQTLTRWLEQPPAWREVVHVFVQAGRGLAAAHAKGLVHRDFKPDNVLIASERDDAPPYVQVTDFGVARAALDDSSTDSLTRPDSGEGPIPTDAFQAELTRDGDVVGTPAYMAPEQLGGLPVGPAADQYAFCVALSEALYGARPFAGNSAVEQLTAKLEGRLDLGRSPAGIPAGIRAALLRGLSLEPEDRFDDLTALLDTLERHRTGKRRVRVWAALAIGLGVAVAGSWSWSQQDPIAVCDTTRSVIESDWNEETRNAVASAMHSTEFAHADEAVTHLLPRVEAWVDEFRAADHRVCVMERSRAPQAERGRACLLEHRAALEVLVRQWLEPTPEVVQQAPTAAAHLPDAKACTDSRFLGLQVQMPAAQAERAALLRQEMTAIVSLSQAGRGAEALQRAESVLEQAQSMGAPSLEARARYTVGIVTRVLENYERAAQELQRAFHLAAAHQDDLTAVDAAIDLTALTGNTLVRLQAAETWARLAETFMARTDMPPDDPRRAHLLTAAASVDRRKADYPAAKAKLERALGLLEDRLGTHSLDVADAHLDLGWSYVGLHKPQDARSHFISAREIVEGTLGEHHPRMAYVLHSIGTSHAMQEDPATARPFLERALEIGRSVQNPTRTALANSLRNLAVVRSLEGDQEAALALLERALELHRETFGPEHPEEANTLVNMALIHKRRGQLDIAATAFVRVIELRKAALGANHSEVVQARGELAGMLYDLGREGEALAQVRVMEQAMQMLDARNPATAWSHRIVADLLWDLDRPAESLPHYERLLEARQAGLGVKPTVATALRWVGQNHAELGEHGKAVSYFERALGRAEQDGETAKWVAAVRRELADSRAQAR